jgi:hypothetical protein
LYHYAQLALAQIAAVRIQPAFLDEYAWGAVFPDIFRLAGVPRDVTHVKKQAMEDLLLRFPQQRSFMQGFRMHLVLDAFDLVKTIRSAFPVVQFRRILSNYLNSHFTPGAAALLVEDYFTRRNSIKTLPPISGKHNEALAALDFSQELADSYAQRVKDYLDQRARKAPWTERLDPELHDVDDIKQDMASYRQLKRRPLLFAMLLLGVKNARLERAALEMV